MIVPAITKTNQRKRLRGIKGRRPRLYDKILF
ncbi:hypothetical protein V6Z12_D01G096200 [Gossypium hirsutum]